MPKGDLVLARVAEAEEKTSGGILLPGSAQVRGVRRSAEQCSPQWWPLRGDGLWIGR